MNPESGEPLDNHFGLKLDGTDTFPGVILGDKFENGCVNLDNSVIIRRFYFTHDSLDFDAIR